MKNLILLFITLLALPLFGQEESDYYRLDSVKIPENIELEVGGMDFTADGKLAVCTRRGEVWIIDQVTSDEPVYTLFARGLHEPLGLAAKDDAIYVSQRQEVTRLVDRDKDGKADVFETVFELPLTGNYHEYHYGPLFMPDGSMLTTLNVGWEGGGTSHVPWRGWMMQFDPKEKVLKPFAAGLRSPAGFGTNIDGEIFVAENQGDWIGSGRITHLAKGDFAGHRESLRWADMPGTELGIRYDDIDDRYKTMYNAKAEHPEIKLPAVWFPHGIMGISTAAIITDRTAGAFGPFKDQLFVSDQGQSKVMRVSLEKVNGEYQGAVFPFREGFRSGTLRMNFGPDNALYVGQTARGWYATGGELFGLEKLSWTGKVPFEMYQIKATEDGFLIEFTKPIDPATVQPRAFTVQNFTYLYRRAYGSPVMDIQKNTVESVSLQPDGKSIKISLAGFRPAYIYEVKLNALRAKDGERLLHDVGYYTLNAIPGASDGMVVNTGNLTEELSSPKRPVKMPADWNGEVDVELLLESAPGMKFKQTLLTVKAGARVQLTFQNPDDMQHNFILTKPYQWKKVGETAERMGLSGVAKGYVPDMDEVIVHTKLVEPETSDIIYFRAPTKKGTYSYICTVPGHYMSMRGTLRVE
ncbi:MAG: plastocyanin/azurin family copper-binding protein [Bacteroidota bacterium]